MFANRAHVNLLLGNNRRALEDAEEAIKLSPANVKVCHPLVIMVVLSSYALDWFFSLKLMTLRLIYWMIGNLSCC